jgi:hypothetical protein
MWGLDMTTEIAPGLIVETEGWNQLISDLRDGDGEVDNTIFTRPQINSHRATILKLLKKELGKPVDCKFVGTSDFVFEIVKKKG